MKKQNQHVALMQQRGIKPPRDNPLDSTSFHQGYE